MRLRSSRFWVVLGILASSRAIGSEPKLFEAAAVEPSAAERGRIALTLTGFLKPEWSEAAYRRAGRLWDQPAPDPDRDPAGYAAAFENRYGLHPAPYPNDGLPMGLRRGLGPGGAKVGLQIDCMACHGGSIGGKSYVGLGNTQLDLRALLNEMTTADGRRPPPPAFVLNSSRGTNNAGQVAAVLMSIHNRDLSFRSFPLPLAANLPEMDTPAWWHLKRKTTMYYDGRTDARSVRTNMQFMLGEKNLEGFQALESDLPRPPGLPQEPRAPEIPVPDRHREVGARQDRLREVVRPMPRHLRARRQIPQQGRPPGRDRDRSGAAERTFRPARRPL